MPAGDPNRRARVALQVSNGLPPTRRVTPGFSDPPPPPVRTDNLFVSVMIRGFRRVDLACASGLGRIETHDSVRVEFESTYPGPPAGNLCLNNAFGTFPSRAHSWLAPQLHTLNGTSAIANSPIHLSLWHLSPDPPVTLLELHTSTPPIQAILVTVSFKR